uniref:Porin n=1 Tax=Gongylonema pulchrum TaxID=637853 RepID=A0A183EWP4_9BILA
LNGQVAWGAHWAVPAASVGGTNGFASVHFPSLGPFFDIEDDYD